ncbi:MAG: hypothetical protein ABIK89_26465, partial [Planctomycetota bacterium]
MVPENTPLSQEEDERILRLYSAEPVRDAVRARLVQMDPSARASYLDHCERQGLGQQDETLRAPLPDVLAARGIPTFDETRERPDRERLGAAEETVAA